MTRPPPSSTLFPSPPLFQSQEGLRHAAGGRAADLGSNCETARLDRRGRACACGSAGRRCRESEEPALGVRSEEHTSELQSQSNLVCRLLLEKKKTKH